MVNEFDYIELIEDVNDIVVKSWKGTVVDTNSKYPEICEVEFHDEKTDYWCVITVEVEKLKVIMPYS